MARLMRLGFGGVCATATAATTSAAIIVVACFFIVVVSCSRLAAFAAASLLIVSSVKTITKMLRRHRNVLGYVCFVTFQHPPDARSADRQYPCDLGFALALAVQRTNAVRLEHRR